MKVLAALFEKKGRRRPCGESLASVGPAWNQPFEKVGKQTFPIMVTDLWSITIINLGSKGSIPWPPEALFLITVTLRRHRFFVCFIFAPALSDLSGVVIHPVSSQFFCTVELDIGIVYQGGEICMVRA